MMSVHSADLIEIRSTPSIMVQVMLLIDVMMIEFYVVFLRMAETAWVSDILDEVIRHY